MKLQLTLPVILCMYLFSVTGGRRDVYSACVTAGSSSADSSFRLTWINDLRKLRDAVYKKDTAVVKSFFSFPFTNSNNDIWYLLLNEKQLLQRKIGEKPVPFTEKDFRLYYSKIFSPEFIKAILKIKTAVLLSTDETETAPLQLPGGTMIKMYVTFDAGEKRLTLNLSYKVNDGATDDSGESNVLYFFSVQPNGHLQFQKIMMAG